MTHSITVLIPTHGRPTLLRRTLDSLAECDQPDGYGEAVVIENGPKAGAESVVNEASAAHLHLRLRYIHVERANKSDALNEALETVRDGLVVFFDDDVRLAPEVLRAYAEAASVYGEGAFFGGPVRIDYERVPAEWIQQMLPLSAQGFEFPDGPRSACQFLGANWGAFALDIRNVGGFNPNFGPGAVTGARGQETDMQKRLREAGFHAVGVDEAVVWHFVPRERCSVGWAIRRRYQDGKTSGLEQRTTPPGLIIKAAGITTIRSLYVRGKRFLFRGSG